MQEQREEGQDHEIEEPATAAMSEDAYAKFVLQNNAGAYSEREREMYSRMAQEEPAIKNYDERHVKKSPNLGTKGR